MELKPTKFYQTRTFRRLMAILMVAVLVSNNVVENMSTLFAGEQEPALSDIQAPANQGPEEGPDGTQNLASPGDPIVVPPELAGGAGAAEPGEGEEPGADERPGEGEQPGGGEQPPAPRNAAEDPSFYSGYAVALESATVYRNARRASADALIRIGAGEALLASARKDVEGVAWFQVSVKDKNDKAVTGWVLGTAIIALSGEELLRRTDEENRGDIADYIVLDGNGVPQVSAAAIEHKDPGSEGGPSATPVPGEEEGEEDDDGDGSEPGATPEPTPEPTATPEEIDEQMDIMSALGAGFAPLDGELLMPLFAPFDPGDPDYQAFLAAIANLNETAFAAGVAGNLTWDNDKENMLLTITVNRPQPVIPGNTQSLPYFNYVGNAVNVAVTLPQDSPLKFLPDPGNYDIDLTSNSKRITFGIDTSTGAGTLEPGRSVIMRISITYDYTNPPAQVGTQYPMSVQVQGSAFMGYLSGGERVNEADPRAVSLNRDFTITVGERTYVDADWDMSAATSNPAPASVYRTFTHTMQAFLRDKDTGLPMTVTEQYRHLSARADLEQMYMLIQIDPLNLTGAAAPDAKTGVYPDRVRITNSNAVLTPARNAQDQIIPGAYIMPVTMEMLNGRNVPVYTRHVIEIDYLATDLEVAFYEYNSNQRYVGAITSALLWQIKGGSVREVKNTNPLSVDAIELRPAYVNFEKLIQVNGATPVQYGGPAQSQYPTNPAGALSLGLNINGTGTPAKLYTRSGGNYVYHGTAVNVYTPNGKNTETFYLAPGQYRLFENGEIIGFTLRDSGVTNLPRNQTGPAIDVTGINSNGGLSVTKVWEINGVQKTAPMPDAVEFTVYTDPALTQVATMILNGAPVPARLSTTATNATVMFSLDFGASNQATFYVAETVPTDANKWFDREPYMQVTVRRGELTAINYVNKIAEITVRTQLEIGNANSIYTFDSTLQGQSGYANFQGVASQADAINLVIGGKTYRPVQVSATGNPFVNDEGELIFRIPESEFAAVNAQANGSYEIRVNGTVRGFGREAVQTTTKQDGALPKTTDARFYMGVVELSKMLHYPYDAGKFIQAPYNATAAALIGNPAISMGLQLGGVNFADIHALDKIGSGSNVRYALDFSAGAIPTGTSRVNVRPMNNGEMRAIIGVPNNPAPATYTFYETVNSADFWPQIGAEPASASVTLSIGNPAQRIVSGYITNQPRKYGAVVIEKFVSEGGTTLENANFQRLATLPANFNPSFTLTAIGSAAPAAGHTDQILQHLDAGSRIVAVFPHIPLGQTATIQENTAGMPGYAPVNGHNAPANWLSDNNTITVSLPASPPQASQFAAGKFYNIRSQAIMALTMQILKRDAAAAVNRATGEGGAFVYNLYRIVPTPGSNTGSVTIGGVTVHYILLPETTFTYNNTNAHLIELPVNIPSSVAGPTVEYVLIQEQHASYEIAPPQLVTLTKGSLVPTPVAVVNKELTRLTISTKQYALTHNTTTHATTAIDGAPWPGSGLTPALTYRITGTPANGSTFTPVSGAVNASGQTVFNMPAGTYTIAINSTLPTGYRRMDDPANDWRTANEIVVTVDSAKSEARTSMLENPNGTICLHKVDSATGAGLGGAVFTRYLGDSGAASQGAVTTSTAAATLGQAVFTNIAPGAYSLIETTAPTGYYGSKDRILVTVPAPAMVGGNYTVPAGVACFSDTVNFARLRAPNTRFTTFQMHKRNVLNGVESNAGANNTYATIMVASGDTYVPFDFTPNQYGNGVEVTPRAGTGSTGLINWRLPAGTYYIFEEPANRYYPGLGDAHSPAITVRERRTFNIGGTNRTGWLLGPYTVTTPTAATTLTHTVRNYYDTVSGVDLFAFANFFASGSASEIDWLNGGVYRLVNVAAPATFYNSTTRTVGGRGAHLFTNGTLGVPVFATSGDNIGAPIEYRVEVATPHARYFRLNSLGSAVRQVALTDADGRVLPASGASAFTPAVPAATDYEGRARQQLSGPKYSYSTFNLYDIMRITEGGNNTRPHLSIQNERRAQIIVPVAGVDCLAHERSTGLEGVTVGLYDRDGARIATTVTGAGGIATFAASDDFYLSAEADYIVVQLSKHGDYIVGSCESPRGLPANLGQLSAGEVAAILSGADTTLNAAAVRCAAFQISDTAPQFFVANVARLENHKPYMRIELTKNWHHVNSAGRYNMQHFGLFEVTYNSANGAAACSEQMSEYVTSVIYGQHGKIITDPVEYGKMYALVEKPASSPRAIHLVMEQSAYDQLLAAGLTTGAPEALPNITHDNDLRLAPWRKRVTNLTHPFAAAVIDAVKGKAGYAGFDEIYITPYDAGYINESKLVPTFADNPRGTGTFRWHIGRIILQKMYIDDFGVTRPRNGVTFAFSLVNTNEDGTVRHRPDGAEDVQPALGLSTTSPRLHEGVLTHGIADSGSFFLHDWRVYPLGPENQENYYWFIRSGGMFFGQDGEEINALRIGAGVPHNFTAAEKARLFTTQAAAQAYAQANAAAVGSNAVVELAYAMPHHPQRPNAQCAGCLARVRISEVGGADGLTVLTDVQDAFVICNADSTDELTIVSHVYYVQNPIVNGDPLKNTYFRVVKYGYQPTSVSAAAWDAIARHYTDPYDRYNAFGEWLAGHLTNATVPNLPAISGAYPSGTLTGVQFQVFKKEGNNYLPVKDSAGNNVIITTSMFGLTSSPVLEAGVEYYLSEITGHPDYINNHNAGSGNAVTDAARLIKVGLMTNANYGRTVYVSNPRKIDLVIEGVDRYNTSVAIPGVSYTLYHSNASGAQGTAVGTGTAGADGQVQFGGLDVGYYLLRANSGWDAARYVNFTATQGDPNVPGGTVNYRSQGLMLIYVPGGTSNLTSTSADMRVQALYPPLPFVGVNKTARVDGARLPGVTLQLLRAGAVIETLTTDANGQVLFATPLTPATYTIVESATGLPSHLMLPANTTVVASFTVSAAGLFSSGTNPTETIGGRVDVVRRNGVVNDRKTRLDIRKLVTENGSTSSPAGAGVVFSVRRNGADYGTITTDALGVASLEMTAFGTYVLEETAGPAGYIAVPGTITVTFSGTGAPTIAFAGDWSTFGYVSRVGSTLLEPSSGWNVFTANVTNPKPFSITAQKVDGLGIDLPGARFGLYTSSACTLESMVRSADSDGLYGTGGTGVLTIGGLLPGKTYYLREEVPPDGYEKSAQVYTVTSARTDAGTAKQVGVGGKIANYKGSGLQIFKDVAWVGEEPMHNGDFALPKIVFDIYHATGSDNHNKGDLAATVEAVRISAGKYRTDIVPLLPGHYLVEEMTRQTLTGAALIVDPHPPYAAPYSSYLWKAQVYQEGQGDILTPLLLGNAELSSSVTIRKVNKTTGTPVALPGAQFKLYTLRNTTLTGAARYAAANQQTLEGAAASYTTGANGEVTATVALPSNSGGRLLAVIEELAPPPGYLIDPTRRYTEVVLFAGSSAVAMPANESVRLDKIEIANDTAGTIILHDYIVTRFLSGTDTPAQYDGDFPLANVAFTLYYRASQEEDFRRVADFGLGAPTSAATQTTDANGRVSWTNLPMHYQYAVHMQTAPDYVFDTFRSAQNVGDFSGGAANLIPSTEQDFTGDGVRRTLYIITPNTLQDGDEHTLYYKVYHKQKGSITIEKHLEAIPNPAAIPAEFTIWEGELKDGSIVKRLGGNNQPIPATFEYSGDTVVNGVARVTGKLTIHNVNTGYYVIEETKAPSGYMLNTDAKAVSVVINLADPRDESGLHHTVRFVNEAYAANTAAIRKLADKARLGATMLRHDPSSPLPVADTVIYTLDNFVSKYNPATGEYTSEPVPYPYESFVVTDKGLRFSAVENDFINAVNQLPYADYARSKYQFTQIVIGRSVFGEGVDTPATARVEYQLFAPGDSETLPAAGWVQLPGAHTLDSARTVLLPAGARAFRVVYDKPGVNFRPGAITVSAQLFVQPDGMIGGQPVRPIRAFRNEAAVDASFHGVGEDGAHQSTVLTTLTMNAVADVNVPAPMPPALVEVAKRTTGRDGEPWVEGVGVDNLTRVPVPVIRGTLLKYTIAVSNRSNSGSFMPDPLVIDRLPEDFELIQSTIAAKVVKTGENDVYTFASGLPGDSVLVMGDITVTKGPDMHVGDGTKPNADALDDDYVVIPFTGNLLDGETLLIEIEGTVPYDLRPPTEVIEINDAILGTKTPGLIYVGQPQGYTFLDYGNAHNPPETSGRWIDAARAVAGNQVTGVIRDFSRYSILPINRLEAAKYARGDADDSGFSSLLVARSYLGGALDYNLTLSFMDASNEGSRDYSDLRIVDTLPQVGDGSRPGTLFNQASSWTPLLDSVKVDYSYLPDGVQAPEMELVIRYRPVTAANDYSDVASGANAFLSGSAGSIGGSTITLPPSAPNTWTGIDAYFAQQGWVATAFSLEYKTPTTLITMPSELMVSVGTKMPAVDDARSAADPARYWTRVQAGDRYYTLANNNAAFTFRYQGGSFIAPAIQMNIVRAEPVPPDVRLGNLVWLDVDGSGVQGAGKPGIQGVTVTLHDYVLRQAGADWTPTLVSSTSVNTAAAAATVLPPAGDNGALQNYLFTAKPYKTTAAGAPFNNSQHWYELELDLPGGYALSPRMQGADRSLDSNALRLTGAAGGYFVLPDSYSAATADSRYISFPLSSPTFGDDLTFDAGIFPSYDVQLKKVDAQGNPLGGAVFELFVANGAGVAQGSAIATATSNAAGAFSFTGLNRFVHYAVKERTAPAYYQADARSLHLPAATLPGGGDNITLAALDGLIDAHALAISAALAGGNDTFKNEAASGSLTIHKKNAKGEALAGAVFEITNTSTFIAGAWDAFLNTAMPAGAVADRTARKITVTMPSGAYTLPGLPYGAYQVTEVRAPVGYALPDPAAFTVRIGDPDHPSMPGHVKAAALEVTDPKITLTVKKVNGEDRPLAGAEFAVYRKADYDANPATAAVLFALATGANGLASMPETHLLAPGDYYLVETKAPGGYSLITDKFAFSVTAAQTEYVIHFTGEDQTPGGKYDIGHPAIVNTSALGAMRINKFVSGTNTRVGGAQFLVMPGTLVVTGAWGLYLADLRANLPLPAGLQIVGDNDPNGYPTDSLLVTLPAAGAGLGTIDITGLPVGTYQVREVAAPLGYALPLADTKTVTVTVTEPGHAFDAVDFEDMRVVLSIEKFDITGNTALSGARFGIFTKAVYDQGAAARIEANAAHVLITGSDGRASTVNLLAPGDYVLVELAPPANYAITFADTPFTVSNRSTVYSYNFTKTAMAGADAASLEVYFGHITNRYTTGGLTIDKKDAEGRNPQTGAEFIIRNKSTLAAPGAWAHFVAGFADTANVTKETENGASVLRAVIPASGTVTIGGLPAGVYEVEEVKAPSGFAIAKPAKGEVTVTASGAPVLYTVINQRVRVDIRKVDGNGQNLADVVFAIHRDVAGAMGAELYELAPTDGQGRAVTTAAQLLAPGAYWLREKSAPAGYTISFEPVRFTVSDTSLRYYYNFTGTPHADGEVEQPFPGPIANSFTAGGGLTIVKQDAETGTRLGGAAFTVAMTSEVASGSWVSYISGAFPANVQRVGQTLRVTLDNTGAFTFEDIPLGTYTVTEVQAPIGYAVTVNDVRTGVAVNEEGVSLTFSNYRRRVEIEKTELGESAKPIAGVKFGIFTEAVYNQGAADRVEANALYVLTTGADGKAATAAGQILDTGAYWLVELEAPANYRITFANRRFEVLASSKVVSFNFTGTRRTPPAEEQYFGKITNDYARGSLRIEKVSAADTSVFLPGAEFTVKPVSLAAGAEAWAYFLDTAALPAHVSVVTEAGQRWLRVVHGSAMSVTTLEGLPIGAYEITETKAPNGYAVAYPASQSAAVAAGVATAVQFRNEYVRVEIEKLDATGQNPVQGAVFGIFAKAVYDLGVLNAATAKYTLTTAANGKAATTSGQLLEPGDYVLVELSAPAGYRISFAPQAFAVSNTTPLYSYNFTATAMNHEDADVLEQYYGAIRNDTATGALKIEKVDAADPARFLTGAEFTVRNVRTAAAEGAWEHFIGGYTPPAGVSIGTESGRSVLRVALGATSGGTITLTGLPTGEYAVTEETAPEGYAVAYPRTQNIAVTVSVSGSANTVQFRNERVRVEIEKVDEAGSPLAGVVFAIYRDNGGAVGGLLYTLAPTGLSGKTGTTESQVLVPGDYWLVELAVPTGYQITFADTKFTVDRTGQVFSYNFTGSARSVAEVEAFYGAIENEFQRSSITIVKRDAETSALLEGAEFILSNTSTVAPGAWDDYLDKLPAITGVSEETRGASRVLRIALGAGSGGTITLNGLPLGVYQVTEALAPVGYAVASPASQTADIVSGSATLTFNNLRARVQIEKLRQDGTGLPGAVFGIFTETAYAAGALNAATAEYVLTTGADGKASTEAGQPLEPGAYWLVELSAPAGYRITFADTKFTVDRASAVFSYNFTAAPRTGIDPSQEEHFGAITNDFIVNQGGLVIEKRDADTNAPLAGAEFTVRQITPVAEGLFGWHHFLDNLDMAANPDVTVATEGAARVLRVVTPAGGPVAVKGMPIGLYEVEETRAPNGYALPLDSVRRITLTETTTPITVTFLDPRARLSLEKVNPEGQAIEGAVFEIRRETQNGDVAYTLTTGASGLAQTLPGQLLSEGTYWLVETFAPVGYTISFAPAWFEVGRESTMFSFNFTATQTPGLSDAQEDHRGAITNEYTQGSLVLRNEDAETGDRLDGGRFIVRNVRTAPGAWQRYLRELDPSNPYLSVETIGGENVLVVIIPPGSNGEIVIPGLPIGDYAVQENKASPGYAIGDIAPKPVTLQDGATDAPVLIFPDNLVRVRLHKLDANGLDLAGVTFGVFTDAAHQNGEPALYTLTTGADGRAATTRHELIDEGDYWLVELSAPVGYAITFPPRAFTVDRTGTVYLYTHTDQTTPPADPAIEERRPAIPNAFATTTLTISKFNEGTQLLEGAEFVLTFVNSVAPGAWEYFAGRFTDTAEVRLWSAAGASGLHITLSDGKDTLYGLPWGEYTLQEVKAPVGYAILDNSVRAVRLGDPAKTDNRYALDDTQDFRDAHLRVRVEKRDEAGNRLAQARFAIFTDAYYRANSASLNIAQAVATLTTDGSGFAETTEPDAGKLVPGTYWLVETAAPPFHDLTFRPVSFAVTREQTKYVYNFTSTAHAEDVAGFEGKPSAAVMNPISTGELLITVSDAETGAPLTGATFRVTASHTLVPGAWDYFLSTLAAAPQPGVTVKLSAKTLTLRLDSPATTFHLTDIPWGEFVVTEISAPSGYALSDPEPIKTAKVGDPAQAGDSGYALTQRAHFVNLRIRLRLEKINEEGQPLPGAQFVINDAAGRLVHTLAPTDANGFTETGLTQLLPPGSYNLVETKAPAGYFIYPDPIPFTVTDTQTRWVFNLTGSPVTGQVPGVFVNIDVPLVDPYGHGALTLEKADAQAPDTPSLAGAVFELTNVSTIVPGRWAAFLLELATRPQPNVTVAAGGKVLVTTAAGGRGLVNRLPWGEYTVREIQAPLGYVISDPAPRTLYLGDAQDALVMATGRPYRQDVTARFLDERIRVQITKINQFGNVLPGVTFLLQNISDPSNPVTVETLRTDSEGFTQSRTLLGPGMYRLTELSTVLYHTITFGGYDFLVGPAQTQAVYDFTYARNPNFAADNGPIVNQAESGTVRVSKIDSVSGTNLRGATFRLRQISARTDAMRISTPRVVSTNASGIAIFADVPYGYYELTETRAPGGYAATTVTQYVTVGRAQRDVTYTFTNGRIIGSVRVYKYEVDENGVEVPLAGAQFTLTGNSRFGDRVNLTGTSDASGYIIYNNVPAGTYRLTETRAPSEEYSVAPPRNVVVDRQGASVLVPVLNRKIGMTGQVLGVEDPDGPNIRGGEELPILNYVGGGALIVAMGLLLLFAQRRRMRAG